MSKTQGLRFGPLGEGTVHLCVDMQQMFDAGTPWATGWLRTVLPEVVRLCKAQPKRVLFTRFIPTQSSDDARGAWRRYSDRAEPARPRPRARTFRNNIAAEAEGEEPKRKAADGRGNPVARPSVALHKRADKVRRR